MSLPELPVGPLVERLETLLFASEYASAAVIAPYKAGIGTTLKYLCRKHDWSSFLFDLRYYDPSADQSAKDVWQILGGSGSVTLSALGARLSSAPRKRVVLHVRLDHRLPLRSGAHAFTLKVCQEYIHMPELRDSLRFVVSAPVTPVLEAAAEYSPLRYHYRIARRWEWFPGEVAAWWPDMPSRNLADAYALLGGHPRFWSLLRDRVEKKGWDGWQNAEWLSPFYDLWTGLLLGRRATRIHLRCLLDDSPMGDATEASQRDLDASGVLWDRRLRPIVIPYLSRRLR